MMYADDDDTSQIISVENSQEDTDRLIFNNLRTCPQCELVTLYGARGSVTAICRNCGYKDPCCGD